MFRKSAEVVVAEAADVIGDGHAVVDDLDRVRGSPVPQRLVNQRMTCAVEVIVMGRRTQRALFLSRSIQKRSARCAEIERAYARQLSYFAVMFDVLLFCEL